MTTFTFNSKESYLAYRREWSTRYLNGTATVRTARQAVRDANRAYSKDPKAIGGIWAAYSELRLARESVSELLLELAKARVEAGRQMQARAG